MSGEKSEIAGSGELSPLVRTFHSLLQRPAASELDFLLHRVAHQWALATALSINSKEDFQSLPKLNVEPYEHQIDAAIKFFRRLAPKGLLADDVGLGKTITAGIILAELMKRRKVKSFLVVCPKLIMPQWAEELKSKFNVEAFPVTGQALKYNVNKNALITTYDSARNYMDKIQARGFDMLILDEAHKLRHLCGVDNPAKRALKFYEALKVRSFRFVLQLTATPLQTSIWDVYSLMDLLRVPDSNPLGPKHDFEQKYLAPFPGRRTLNPRSLRPEAKEEFRRRLSEVMIRTRRFDTKLNFPERIARTDKLDAGPEERSFIERAVATALRGGNVLEQINLMLGALSSPHAAAVQIRKKIDSHTLSEDISEADAKAIVDEGLAFKSSAKLERVIAIVSALQKEKPEDWRVVIFTCRTETLKFIQKALQDRGLGDKVGFIQGSQGRANQQAIEDFKAEPPRVHVIVSTDAGAEGVNLQAGNVLINYDLPWNPMTIEQRIGRIQRLGQKAKNVIVYNLVIKDTVEERVVARLLERLRLFESAIGEMEAILSQAGIEDGDDDPTRSFESFLLELVKKAQEKQDTDKDIELKRQSIDAARRLLEEAHSEMEQFFGRIDPGASGPIMPQLVATKPELPLQEFTLSALTAGGGAAEVERDGITYRVSSPRRGEFGQKITFDPAHPMFEMGRLGAATVTLYAEGERPFEHLVHEWMGAAQCLIKDTRGLDDTGLTLILRMLLDSRNLKVQESEIEIVQRKSEILPEITWKANVSVYHDQYEKLLTTLHLRPEHGMATWIQNPASDAAVVAKPGEFGESLANQAIWIEDESRKKAAIDQDIRGFSGFYESRLLEELGRLDRFSQETNRTGIRDREVERTRKDDLNRRFKPELNLEPLALKGLAYEVVTAQVRLKMGTKELAIPIAFVPLSRAIITPWTCASSGVALTEPAACVGGHLVNQGQLSRCSAEGCVIDVCTTCTPRLRPACPACNLGYCGDHHAQCSLCKRCFCSRHQERTTTGTVVCGQCTEVCEESGVRLPKSDLARCAVSGKLVDKSLLVTSALSGKGALAKHMSACQETGQKALQDELGRCEFSDKTVLPSLLARCPDTNKTMLKALMAKCEATGIAVHPDALSQCQESGAKVRAECLETCQTSGKRVLKKLLHTSAASGKRALTSLGAESAVSGKWALSDELLNCEVSGARALPEEFVFCSVTGKRVLPSLVQKCSVTGRIALKEELARSTFSGKLVLKSLLKPCEETGRLALETELVPCLESGKKVLPPLLEKCSVSGGLALPQHMAVSQLSGKRVRKSLLVPCQVSGRLGLPDELVACAVTGKKVDPALLQVCVISGKKVLPDALVSSQVSSRRAIAAHSRSCPACGVLHLDDEKNECHVCHISQCVRCCGKGDCVICAELRSDGIQAIPSGQAPPELAGAWPKAVKWKFMKRGRLTIGIGIPGALNLFTRKRLIALRDDGAGHPAVVTNNDYVAQG